VKPKLKPVLDPAFAPLVLALGELRQAAAVDGQDVVVGVARGPENIVTYATRIVREGSGGDERNFQVLERLVKSLLWAAGGYRIVIAGGPVVGERIKAAYRHGGLRDFDVRFMERVYERPFDVELCGLAEAPGSRESAAPVGRHLDGCRIGFDAGGSDRKVSAVIDGESVYSEEVVWRPKTNSDPAYHYAGVVDAFRSAAAQLPRVDAIGVSSAGVYVDNRVMVASLFLEVSDADFEHEVKDLYVRAAQEVAPGAPLVVANDGDVTALAGAMDLGLDRVLGVAMGTSEAGGYVDGQGNITGRLNELAFVPVDLNPDAAVDEWSGDHGCGVKYFSQDGVIKLARAGGITLDPDATPAEQLAAVQHLLADGHPVAADIFSSIGVCFGYALAWYAEFYELRHVLLMGRVTSGRGGALLVEHARAVLAAEFPELRIQLHLPDESARRVGQSVAAASLPELASPTTRGATPEAP